MSLKDSNQDTLLLSRYLESGDERAFGQLVANHATMLTATATRICGKDDAPDAIQAALITFANKAVSIRNGDSLGAWLHRVVTLEAMSMRRRHIRQKEKKQQLTEAMKRTEVTESTGLSHELDATISTLNSKDREVVVLHYLEGQSFRAIANRLGGTEAAWQKRSVRALAKLTKKLRLRGIAVPVATLAAFFASQPCEASSSQILCQKLATQALAQKSLITTSTSSTLITLMNAKLATLITFGTGLTLSSGWTTLRQQDNEGVSVKSSMVSTATRADYQATRGSSQRRPKEDIFSALADLDEQEEVNTYLESCIRAAVFNLPLSELPELLNFLQEVEKLERFQEIAAACFARWAELDAEAAWVVMLEEETYRWQAQRAVVQTWVHLDPEAALAKVAEDKKRSYRDAIWAYVKRFAYLDPVKMANFLVLYDGHWPQAAEKLFPVVAETWAKEDPVSAGQWITSYEDIPFRENILQKLAPKISRSRGRMGMELADLITDPKKKAAARMQALRWWAISNGAYSLRETNPNPEIDLRSGIPNSWSAAELKQFSTYYMINFSARTELMTAIAKTEEDREFINQGILAGSAYSDPSIGMSAIPQLSLDYLNSKVGRKDLKTVVTHWERQDPEALQDWLSQQPADGKAELVRELLK